MPTIDPPGCIICGRPVNIKYYFCYKHLEYKDSKLPWVKFLKNNVAAERMRHLSRAKSKTQVVNFSDLGTTDQKNLGIHIEKE